MAGFVDSVLCRKLGKLAPVAACFLARLGRGHSIRDLIKINFGIPVVINILWMGAFSNLALNFQLTGRIDLVEVLNTQGAEGMGYAILKEFPLGNVLIAFSSLLELFPSSRQWTLPQVLLPL